MTALPGGTDFMDVYWSQINQGRNLWNNWNGYPSIISSDPSVQPIGLTTDVAIPKQSDIAKMYKESGNAAASKPYQAYSR